MAINNKMSLTFLSRNENEAFARNAVGSFLFYLNPTVEQLSDIKTAVSEAVTNAIVHGYSDQDGKIELNVEVVGDVVHITITDYGVGIEDIEVARMPFYTTKKQEERSGMGFTVMECVMDSIAVTSEGQGVTVELTKRIG